MSKRNIEAVYPLSPTQQGMLFHSLYAPSSGVYVELVSCTLRGDLDVAAFERAWRQVMERHPVLRTAFVWKNLDKTLQVVYRQLELPLQQLDWRALSPTDQEAQLEAFLRSEGQRGLDLARAPLMRLTLMRIADDASYFVWTHHHILLDGWSLPLIFKDVFALYEAFRQGTSARLEPARPYRDYITWLQRQDLAAAEVFWRRTLQGVAAPTPLMIDRAAAGEEVSYAVEEAWLSAGATSALQSLVRRQQVTLNTLVQGAWALLLSRYSGTQDVVFGATVSGRPPELPGVESMVGLFINTLPVRVKVAPDAKLSVWLKQLHDQQVELRQYEYSPLVQVQGWSEMPRGVPLFESLLVFENYPVDASLRAQKGSLAIERVRAVEQTNYPLTVLSGPGEELGLKISYDCRRFDAPTITRMLGHLAALLEGMAANPDCQLSALQLLTAAEREQLLVEWNDTARAYPQDLCLHELFEAQVARSPEAVALVFDHRPPTTDHRGGEGERGRGGEEQKVLNSQFSILNSQFSYMTYRELNERANQLAHHLRSLGVGPDTLVGICAERSLELVIGLYAILKAGGAYLPLDPSYPAERLRYMLADAQVAVLLTSGEIGDWRLEIDAAKQSPISNFQSQIVDLVADWPTIAQQPATNLESHTRPEHLAYVIYTSGSTGRPKGVLVPHRGIVNRLLWMQEEYGLTADEGVMQKTPFSFDVSVWEFFWPLIVGARLVLARPEGHKDSAYLRDLIQAERVTTLHFVPPMLRVFLEQGGIEECRTLRRVICSGEALPYELQQRCFARLGEVELHNLYGPTEAAVDVTYWACRRDDKRAVVPIGVPVANTQMYVLDQWMQPAPVGVAGELYIGGVQLARGYLGRPDLTAERFIPNPFAQERVEIGDWRLGGETPISNLQSPISSLLYKTGDLCRYLPDGAIEYLGRIDQQVKIRGFRIELGEIAAVLGQHPDVREAVVLAREDVPGDRRLVAYVVPGDWRLEIGDSASDNLQSPISNLLQELRPFLLSRLPDYMVPSAFVLLDALPLNPNGKVDRKALPAPDATGQSSGEAYVAPRTPVEEILAGIWGRLLGVARVGAHDNFFALGGHSLLATQLLSRLREALQAELPLRSLFDAPTLAGMAAAVDQARRASAGPAAPPLLPVSRADQLPLSFAQQRLWFLDQLEPESPFYNNPSAVRLTGPLNVAAFEQGLNEIVRRHEVLRTSFATVDGRPVQVIAPVGAGAVHELPLHLVDLRHVPAPEREAEAQRIAVEEIRRPFDLARGPLVRAKLLRLEDQEHIALLTIHHIVSDGWSIGVFVRELAALYEAFAAGRPSPLPALPIQYADFAAWQRTWLQGTEGQEESPLQQQLAYWKQQLRGSSPMLELPTDRPRPAVQTSQGAHYVFELPPELSEQLRALSRESGVTLFMTLLAAFQTLLYRYSGQEDINVGTPIANRTRAEIEPLIGFFVNTLVLRGDLSGDPTFRELLTRVREAALGAYAHQDVPFEMIVEALQPARTLSHTPLFQVMLVLNNAPVEVLRLRDLTLSPVKAESGTARFDLTLELMERPDGLYGSLEYNTDLFDVATIGRMLGHFQVLLEGIVANPEYRVSALPLLMEAERRQVLIEWNATARDYPDQHCFHHLFEAQAARAPEAIALLFEGRSLTYRELNQQANRLAHYLQARGVGPETLVGICVERSPAMIIAVLAVLKAGGAYLPLDPSYPADRLQYMLHDAQVSLLLTSREIGDWRLESDAAHQSPISNLQSPAVVYLDADWDQIAREPTGNPASAASADSLAYVIYTSGSTGRPKGTLLRHRGLCNLLTVQRQVFAITPESRVLQFAPFSFDASVWETVMALGNGAALVLAPQARLVDGAELLNLLREARVTTVTLPPSVLAVLDPDALPALQTVIAAGEACSHALVERWGVGRRFVNAYGPTETTVCASLTICDPLDPRPPTIGRPLPNVQLYVLDRHLQPLPIGVPGELYIGGLSLARGYLHRPELTAERFVPNPFRGRLEIGDWRLGDADATISNLQSPISDRLYKSGDLVRYRPDGELEFLGRVDQQVKLRGFRIELGEVAAVLRQHAGVQDALVLAREDGAGEQRLVAYVVPRDWRLEIGDTGGDNLQSPISNLPTELRAYLRERLPEYMVPWGYVAVEEWPLTPSGKVDRGALPLPDGRRPEVERAYVAPRNETEATLAGLCGELLGLAQVGVEDNFFELGGHSLMATQLLSRVRERFQVELPLRSLFENPTVAHMAEIIDSTRATQQSDADKIAEMLTKINQLSEDEVRALLDDKKVVLH